MSVPKGKIHMMQSIIKNKNNFQIHNIERKPEVKSKPKTQFIMKTHLFNNMNLVHKKGVSHLAYKEAKKDKVKETDAKETEAEDAEAREAEAKETEAKEAEEAEAKDAEAT